MSELDFEIAGFLANGDWQKAAAALRHRGDLVRAQELYERAWDFENAAAVALERKDALAELRIALRRQDEKTIDRAGATLRSAPVDAQRQAAVLFEQHHRHLEAASLREAMGELDAAQDLYRHSGGSGLFHLARLDEKSGRLREAAEGYAAALQHEQGTADERTRAALGRGRVLLRCGDLDEAVRALQDARRQARASQPAETDQARFLELLDEIEAQLIDTLVALGEPEVARPVLTSYASRHPDAARYIEPAEFVQRRAEPARGEPEARLLGRYQLTQLLGAGSMGRVYLATDETQRREVAVKLLPLAASASPAHLGLYRRFCREAEILRGLRHPNLVEVYDFHSAAGVLVMEYLPGGALSEARLPLPLSLVRRILREVIDALLLVHGAGVLHRDIKPHNLFLSRTGTAKLGDFGAATLRDIGLTQTAGLVGTLAYMSPEQIQDQDQSFATDVYGLAVTAFELCTGKLPFPGPDFIEQHLSSPPPDARTLRPAIPEAWAVLLQRLLAKSSAERCVDLETLRTVIASLPAPALVDDGLSLPPEPAPVVVPVATTPPAFAPLLRTAKSALLLTTDARLGRPMIVERFTPEALASETGAAHTNWLRELSRRAGPGLQRVLRVELQSPQGAQVYFDVPSGLPVSAKTPLTVGERVELRRLLARLHDAGVVHGSVARAVMREPGQLLLLIAGHGPLTWTAPRRIEHDLEDIAALSGARAAD